MTTYRVELADSSADRLTAFPISPTIRAVTRIVIQGSERQKKLTITLDERVYEGLHSVVGRRRISQFIESLVRPHVIGEALDASYREMAREESREVEASEWADGTSGDVGDETR